MAAALVAGPVAGRPLHAQPGLGLGDIQVLSTSISVRVWTVENGLPQSSVTELRSDRYGYIWGATFGGLFRFDGRSIRQYTAADLPILTGNSVTALALRADGDLMIGTPSGTVGRIREGRLVDTLPNASVANAALDGLLEDGRGGFWARYADKVVPFHNGRWGAPLKYGGVTALLRDSLDRLIYAGPDGIVRVDPDGTSRLLSAEPKLVLGTEYGAHVDAAGRLWIGNIDGLWVYEEGRGARRIVGSVGAVNAITTDAAGEVWFGSGGKLFRYGYSRDGRLPVPVLDTKARVVSIATTHDGLIVVGTLEGLLLVRENFVNVVDESPAIRAVETGSLAGHGDGSIWLSSSCSDVLRMGRNRELLDSIPRPNPEGCTRSVLRDGAGNIWVGGDGAIGRRAPDRSYRVWRIDSLPPQLSLVRPLLEVGDRIVFGVSDGRIGEMTRDGQPRFLPGWQMKTDKPIESIALAADGSLWVGQKGRLSHIVRGRVVSYDHRQAIPNSVPRALHADGAGNVWIGTYGSGLWHFLPGGRARAVPVIDQTISAILVGAQERVWMPGNRGLSVVTMSSLEAWLADSTQAPDLRLMSYTEGVPEGNIGYPAATRVAEGVLAFSSVTGLVVAHTAGVVTSGLTPSVHIDELQTPAGAAVVRDGRVVIYPEARALFASVSMPSFRFSEVAVFRYRVDEGPWLPLSNRRELQLTLSRPGTYTLQVQGRVPGGQWETAEPLALDVEPRFIELAWPRWLLSALLIALLGVLARQRVRTAQLAAKAREIEAHARRDAALLAEHHQREMAQVGRVAVAGELTASLSHELGQPLAAIVNNAEVARRLLVRTAKSGVDPRVEQALLDVVAQGRRASQVVREFRRFLKRERGEREAVVAHELIDSATILLRREYDAHGVSLRVRVEPGTPAVDAERVLLQQVLVNLLYNALEATRRIGDRQVLVRARPSGDGLRISVVDNGAGFAADVRRSAFEPFVTTRDNGMGMGLAIARRVVESHGGHIAVGHLASAGAVVSLWLPVRHMPLDRSDSLVPLQVTVHE